MQKRITSIEEIFNRTLKETACIPEAEVIFDNLGLTDCKLGSFSEIRVEIRVFQLMFVFRSYITENRAHSGVYRNGQNTLMQLIFKIIH